MGLAYRWFNRVLPRLGLQGVLAFLVLLTGIQWLFYGVLYLAYEVLPDNWARTLVHRLAIPVMLFTWAGWRSTSINPAFRTAYRNWLATTPWTPGGELPLGPVHLVWQDAVLLAAASALVWLWPGSLLVPLAFLLPYCWMLGLANYRAGEDEALFAAVLLGALLPLSLVYVERYPWAPLALTGLITAETLWGWRRTIRLFPWENLPRFVAAEDRSNSRIKNPRYDGLWPRVHPLDSLDLAARVSWRQILMIATGVAWVAAMGARALLTKLDLEVAASVGAIEPYAGMDDWKTGFDEVCKMIIYAHAWLIALARLGIYAAHGAAPISLRGRLATRRFIIPGYDRIFVAPLAVVALGMATPTALFALGLPLPVVIFASLFLILLAAFGLGPSLAEWNLTGEHRLRVTQPKARQVRSKAARAGG